MFARLNALDTRLFRYLNGHHSPFWDPVMYWASDKLFWIPFYALILFLIIRHYRKASIWIILCIGMLITLSDQLSSHLIKGLVRRLRPSHEPALAGLVHLSKAGAGGMYGFVSGHAANSFALLVFLSLILARRFRWLKYVLACWALLVCYSRVYVGVHYPGDVVCGALLGALVGWAMAWLYKAVVRAGYFRPAVSGIRQR
jgi:undecaprenyl-diphosphatase